jgi:hypothetical protein
MVIGALASTLVVLALQAASFAAGSGDLETYSPEKACTAIKSGLRELADAERSEALALDLTTDTTTAAMVEVRLNALIDRSQQLRATLAAVRMSSVAHDSDVEECVAMGFHSLESAEKLSSDVEEILYSGGYPVAVAPELTPSGAREPASGTSPTH